jgi:L-ribulose-5-phosphate 3-epimerase
MEISHSRREFMLKSAGALAGLAIAGCKPASCEMSKAKPCSNGFKIGSCDWTFGKMAELSALDEARRYGLDGLQIDFGSAEDELPLRKPEVQQKYLDALNGGKLEIASLAMVGLGWVPYKSDPRWEQWAGDGIDAAKAMGEEVLLFGFFGKGELSTDTEGRQILISKLNRLAPKAEKAGVIIALESWMTAEQNMEVIDKVGSPAVQVYYDVGNSRNKGYDIYKEIRYLGNEHICQVHAKDYGAELFGEGDVDFERVREAIDDIGYRGWIVFEDTTWAPKEAVTAKQEAKIRKNIAYLRKIFPPKV